MREYCYLCCDGVPQSLHAGEASVCVTCQDVEFGCEVATAPAKETEMPPASVVGADFGGIDRSVVTTAQRSGKSLTLELGRAEDASLMDAIIEQANRLYQDAHCDWVIPIDFGSD